MRGAGWAAGGEMGAAEEAVVGVISAARSAKSEARVIVAACGMEGVKVIGWVGPSASATWAV
jgi:hypothetical protein